MNKIVRKYMILTLACFSYAAAVSLFLDPNALAPGGVTGISVILSKSIGLGTGTWFLILNIPILILGAIAFGIKFILSTMYCIAVISVLTDIFSVVFGCVTNDLLLAGIAGASLLALGIGLVMKQGATTGGMDIIVKLLKRKFPYQNTGSLFLILDVAVVAASAIVFRNMDLALYAGLVVFLISNVLDLVLYGKDKAKLLFIISDNAEEIAERILSELDVGITFVEGQGAYSKRNKKVILCVVKKQVAIKTEQIVKETDPQAFMIISSASEIYGEGYKSYYAEKL